MKRALVLMLALGVVEGLVVTAAPAEAGIRRPSNEIAASDNIVLTASAVTVLEIQDKSEQRFSGIVKGKELLLGFLVRIYYFPAIIKGRVDEIADQLTSIRNPGEDVTDQAVDIFPVPVVF